MSQNPSSQKVKIYTFSTLALVCVTVLLRIVNFLCIYDAPIGYFEDHPLHTVYRALCFLTVIWLLSMLVFIPRYSYSPKAMPVTGLFSRCMALFCSGISLASFFFFRDCMRYYEMHAKFYQNLTLLCLVAAAYFLLNCSEKLPAAARALCGYATLIWLGAILSVTYLNLYVPMNSPFKVTLHMALITMMLHVLEDARRQAGRPFRIHYYMYTLAAILCSAVASFPVLIAYFFKIHPDVDYLFYAVLMLGFFLYLCARAADYYRMLMTTPPATPEEIATEEEKRTQKKSKGKKADQNTNSSDTEKGDNAHVS